MAVVGRDNAGLNPVPNTPQTSVLPSISATWSTNIANRFKDAKIYTAPSSTQQQALLVDSLTKPQLSNLANILKKLGYTKSQISTGTKVKDILLNDFNSTLNSSPTYSSFANSLASDALAILSDKEPTLPTRAISKLDKAETFMAMDSWAEKKLMRTLEADEKEDLFKELEKLNQGTVTTYTKVKNKKGQMENVQMTTPGLTPEKAQATIEQKLVELNPDDADRAARIRFADFLSGSVEGI